MRYVYRYILIDAWYIIWDFTYNYDAKTNLCFPGILFQNTKSCDNMILESNIPQCKSWIHTNYNVFICFHMQLYLKYYQVCNSLNISCAVVKILGLTKWRLWCEFSQKVARVSKYFLSIFWSMHWPLIRYIDWTFKTGSWYISHTSKEL